MVNTRLLSLSRATRRGESESGAALVEFALVLPVVLLVLFAIVDFGKAFNYWNDTTHLANEGARWAMVNKNPSTTGTLQQYIAQQADTPELESGGTNSVPNALEVCITFPSGSGTIGEPVKVEVKTDYHFLPFLGDKLDFASKTVSGSSTMRLEATPTNYAPNTCS